MVDKRELRDTTIDFEAPSVAQWREDSEIANAGTKGWNPLQNLEALLHKNIPGLRPFKIGFCSDTDLPTWKTIGWVHMRRDHFKVENFNEAVGLGMSLQDDTGVIRHNDNYLMMMPKDYRKRVQAHRNEVFEEQIERTKRAAGHVDPQDPNAEELRELAKKASEFKEEQFRVGKP